MHFFSSVAPMRPVPLAARRCVCVFQLYGVGRAIFLFFPVFFFCCSMPFSIRIYGSGFDAIFYAVSLHHMCVCVSERTVSMSGSGCCGCFMLSIFIQIKFIVKRDEYMVCAF